MKCGQRYKRWHKQNIAYAITDATRSSSSDIAGEKPYAYANQKET